MNRAEALFRTRGQQAKYLALLIKHVKQLSGPSSQVAVEYLDLMFHRLSEKAESESDPVLQVACRFAMLTCLSIKIEIITETMESERD